jgi:hypothetical protein
MVFTPGSALFDRREELSPLLPPAEIVARIIRSAYWRFYGSRRRWWIGARNMNVRNGIQMLRRLGGKFLSTNRIAGRT